jgi:hypothetical protein
MSTSSTLQAREQHVQALLRVAQRWIAGERLQLLDIEYAVHEAGLRLYLSRDLLGLVPVRDESPDELLVLTRPAETVEDYGPAQREYWTNWLAGWLACCAPGDEAVQDAVLREIAIWARSEP